MSIGSAELSQLIDITVRIGGDPKLVQGPGGNISLKSDADFYIKASGTRMRDALVRDIFCSLEIFRRENGELDWKFRAKNSDQDSRMKPSIEIFFHTLIKSRYVVHVHSIGAVALSLRPDAEQLLSKIYGSRSAFIQYFRPGLPLANAIRNKINQHHHDLAVLQNHGLLVWGDDLAVVYERLIKFETLVRSTLASEVQSEKDSLYSRILVGEVDVGFLTPDHAVFSKTGLSNRYAGEVPRNSDLDVSGEIEYSLLDALKLIPGHIQIRELTRTEIEDLVNGDDEKYRVHRNSI